MNYLRRKIYNLRKQRKFRGYLHTISGTNEVSFDNALTDYPSSISVSGNMLQDGTPSSTEPVEIYSVGDKCKNLADQANVYLGTNSSNRVPYPNRTSKGYILDNSINRISLMPCKIEEGKTYTCSYSTEYITGDLSCSVFYIKNPEEGLMQYLQNGKSFVANFDATLLGIYVSLGEGETNPNTGEPAPLNQIRISEVMLNEGDTALPYEEYYENYKIQVLCSSKNLSNISTNGTIPNYWLNVYVKEGKQYTFSAKLTGAFSTANGFHLKINENQTTSFDFTSTNIFTKTNISIGDIITQSFVAPKDGYLFINGYSSHTFEEIQIEIGSVETPIYEDFKYDPFEFDVYLPESICGNDTVSDIVTLDVDKRKAVMIRNFKKVIVDGSLTSYGGYKFWNTQEWSKVNHTVSKFRLQDGFIDFLSKQHGVVVSNYFLRNTEVWSSKYEGILCMGQDSSQPQSGGAMDVSIYNSTLQNYYPNDTGEYGIEETISAFNEIITAETEGEKASTTYRNAVSKAFNNWLIAMNEQGNPLIIWYELNPDKIEGETIDISDLQDWISIEKLSKNCTNIIIVNSSISVQNIEVKYYSKERL